MSSYIIVGWLERSETKHFRVFVGFRYLINLQSIFNFL